MFIIQSALLITTPSQITSASWCLDGPGHNPLYKVRSWLDVLNKNCREMFSPHRQLTLDEMDISVKGRSQHKQRIKYKRAGDGFLNYALSDATNGYLSVELIFSVRQLHPKMCWSITDLQCSLPADGPAAKHRSPCYCG